MSSTPAKVAKKAAKPKVVASHPKYAAMVAAGVGALKERSGSSRQAILKYIISHYSVGKDERVINRKLKVALRAGVRDGDLKQTKGTGASGSFRLGEKAKAAPKKVAKKPKAAVAKKAKSPKKAAAKKVVKKSPKKAKTPARKPAAKKLKSPAKKAAAKARKPKVAAAKKPKAAKPKKTPAKKAAKKT